MHFQNIKNGVQILPITVYKRPQLSVALCMPTFMISLIVAHQYAFKIFFKGTGHVIYIPFFWKLVLLRKTAELFRTTGSIKKTESMFCV